MKNGQITSKYRQMEANQMKIRGERFTFLPLKNAEYINYVVKPLYTFGRG